MMVLLAATTQPNARVYGVAQGTATCLPDFIHIAFVPGYVFYYYYNQSIAHLTRTRNHKSTENKGHTVLMKI